MGVPYWKSPEELQHENRINKKKKKEKEIFENERQLPAPTTLRRSNAVSWRNNREWRNHRDRQNLRASQLASLFEFENLPMVFDDERLFRRDNTQFRQVHFDYTQTNRSNNNNNNNSNDCL